MEIKARLEDIRVDFVTGDAIISISTTADKKMLAMQYEELNNKVLDVKLTKARKKRSLDANAYAWVLMSKIADKLGSTKEEVYMELIRQTNFFEQDDDGMPISVICKPQIDMTRLGHWCFMGWVGDNKSWMLMKGSSEYDSYEMSKFINMIVDDAKDLGIETMTPKELAQMLGAWK